MGETTIVTCVEAGPLEAQVLLLAESLRTFGGSSSNIDFIAVKPRRGPGIAAHTRREFRRLGVEFVDLRVNVARDWWDSANKSAATAEIEARISTPNLTWMDGDMIVLRPLDKLAPTAGRNFIARAGEGYLGSNGADENAPYWRKLCALMGLDFDAFPIIQSFPEGRSIRAYWQSGIYTYATATGLGHAHYEMINRLFSTKIASRTTGIYHQDQVSLALAVQELGLTSSEYTAHFNYNLNPLAKRDADILPIQDVKVLHYHGGLFRESVDWAMSYIDRLGTERAELVRKYVPLSANATFLTRVHKKILKSIRRARANSFKQQTTSY
jgi:hypothetical protein